MPLALAVQAQVKARLLEGGLQGPTPDEVDHDLAGRQLAVGRQEGLGFAAVFRIAHQHESESPRVACPSDTTRRCRWPVAAGGSARRTSRAGSPANGYGCV